ncbi:TetR/AcrR family transcriptional regulator [Ruegeria sp. ANG-S4]|uniref:TetR/AcrR family transcriptional regulator n=1 Tax=Ruegeria sp. ANG-S4 TaxID=1577904 RepID=UPI000691A83E|nr:TetR/AcrR family transcriptional regulator [Ruegeria sp. ANG-S4]
MTPEKGTVAASGASVKIKEDQIITFKNQRSVKEARILDCALKLLIEAGDAGLTMRRIADCADMRLSNVQYYFKSRDDVLIAMVEQYFDACAENLLKLTEESKAQTRRERVRFLVSAGLSHGLEISDMCRAFREIWAISSRNAIIDTCLTGYYRRFADVMADYAFGEDLEAADRDGLKALLVPYFEGYSVTARALTLDTSVIAEMLTDIVLSLPRPPLGR